MTWHDLVTWVAGEIVTAAQLNQQLRDNLQFLFDRGGQFYGQLVPGRLTLVDGEVVPTADVTGSQLYYTPVGGKGAHLWVNDGRPIVLTQVVLDLGSLAPDTMHDIYLDHGAGLQLRAVAWTSDTTRGVTPVLDQHVYVRPGLPEQLYVGTIRTDDLGRGVDTAARRWVWNHYNRVDRVLAVQDPAASWDYTADVWRQANGNPANQIDVVVGLPGDVLEVHVTAVTDNLVGPTRQVAIGDAGGAPVTGPGAVRAQSGEDAAWTGLATAVTTPAAGRHVYQWLERSGAAGVTTWFGQELSGMWGRWRG